MSNRSAYLISCSDHYDHRLHVVDNYLRSSGYDTIYITSDFDHTSKKTFSCDVPGCVQLHVRPYRKNLSAARMLSHREFARAVFRYLQQLEQQPDVIVALLPPNFLADYLARYKRQHPQVKLIFDIFDLWPETFPAESVKRLLTPVFGVWAWIRDHSLPYADFVTTECEMFRRRLGLQDGKSATVYLCADPLREETKTPQLRENGLDLCYLGAINYMIAIPEICTLIRKLVSCKPVTLHVIGTGERQQEFLDAAKEAGAEVKFYGPVYDAEEKQEIIRKCHFGLNVVKASACIGLTMKSVDYWCHGLPVISNVPADTQMMVEKYAVGIQLTEHSAEKIGNMSVEDCMKMRKNVCAFFHTHFSRKVIDRQYQELFNGLL